jgi:hypothetical protein
LILPGNFSGIVTKSAFEFLKLIQQVCFMGITVVAAGEF